MASPDSPVHVSKRFKLEDEVRYMTEEEKKALRDVIFMSEEGWEIGEWFSKSKHWESLKWSPVDSSELEEGFFSSKSVYLQVESSKKSNYCLWFAVAIKDLLDGDNHTKKALSPVLGEELRMMQRTVALPPNRIVALGGSYPPNSSRARVPHDATEISWCDITDPSKKWHEYPKMPTERHFPTVVVLEGRIYVFGGQREPSNLASYLEIFDTEAELWSTVGYTTAKEMPPLYGNIQGVFSDPEGRRHLVFHSSPGEPGRSIHTLDLIDYKIQFGEKQFPQLFDGCQVVDGILYAYLAHTEDVRAYDLDTKIWLPGPVIESDVFVDGFCRLLQVGVNMLCALGDAYSPIDADADADGPLAAHLRFKVFKLDKERGVHGLRVKAVQVSSKSFYCPDGRCLWGSLII